MIGKADILHQYTGYKNFNTTKKKGSVKIMSLLEITGLTHSFGEGQLFKNAELTLNKGEHIGIVGPNGAGKSTLIKICTEQVIPDTGRVAWHPQTTIGYLDQYAQLDSNITMEEFLRSAFRSLYLLEEKMNRLYEEAASRNMEALKSAAGCQEELEIQGFYTIDTRIEQVVSGLGLRALGLSCPVSKMSGGQRAKVILAKLLLEKPDVLLLDEPTNFLDKEHVAWLADYLSTLENAFLTVSHDFDFLEKIANRICDIDNNRITKYYGTYSEFLKKKTLLREDYIRQYSAQQKEIKKTEEFIRKNMAGRKTRMARGRQKQLDRMDKMEALNVRELKPYFRFAVLPLTATEPLSVRRLSVGYHYPLLSDLDFSVTGGQKVVITGFNGIGKSTLLKTLLGQIPAQNGSYSFSQQVKIGYFEQDLHWPDNLLTPVQIVSDAYPDLTVKEIRKRLSLCGITSKHAARAIGTLSGGEQAKVKLCLLTLTPCNFLILDEPTNHLDLQAKASLKTALSDFPGSILLVSHEEGFYSGLVHKTIDIEKIIKKK